MDLFFKNSLLGTSCLIISLGLSHPAFSMDDPEDKSNLPRPTKSIIHPIQEEQQEEEQQESYFITTEFANQKFDHNRWVKDFITAKANKDKVNQLFLVLETAANDGDEHALMHLHTFSTSPFLGINKVNPEKAAQALKSGCRREQPWVVEIYQKKIQDLTNELRAVGDTPQKREELIQLHRDVANNQLCSRKFPNFAQQSERYLETLFPFNGVQWYQSYCIGKTKETFTELLSRLKKYGYYKHYESLYMMMRDCGGGISKENAALQQKLPASLQGKLKAFNEQKCTFLEAAAELNHTPTLVHLCEFYKEKNKTEKAIKIHETLAKEKGIKSSVSYLFEHFHYKGDHQQAFQWLAKTADKYKDALSQGDTKYSKLFPGDTPEVLKNKYYLTICLLIQNYWFTHGEKKDLNKAFKWAKELEVAAEKDKLLGKTVFFILARCYHHGQSVEQDKKQALKYYEKAAQCGKQDALLHMIHAYLYGEGVDQSFAKAINYCKDLKFETTDHYFCAGICYEQRGNELKKQGHKDAQSYFKQAIEYYTEAAEKKCAPAMYNLARLYFKGDVIGQQNIGTAKKWYEQASLLGDIRAMNGLATIYLSKQFKDPKLAKYWLEQATTKGKPSDTERLLAMTRLACLYVQEYNDYTEGLRLSKEAADLGCKEAQYDYARFLINQPSENKTENTEACAFFYFVQSATNGCPDAMVVLGKSYLGRNASSYEQKTQDLESAYFWFKKAAPYNKIARVLLEEVEKQLASNEIDDSPVSPEFESCLENIHNMEKREIVADETEGAEEITMTHSWKAPTDCMKESSETSSSDNNDIESAVPLLQVEENVLEEPEESFETWKLFHAPKNEEIFNNPKLFRAQLKAAGLALKKKQENLTAEIPLSPDSLEIVRMLKDKDEQQNITYGLLHKLFSDPLFKAKGHVELYKTKSGIAISAKSFVKMEAFSASTHHNHDKTYKGYNPAFLKKAVHILSMFGV